LATTIAVLSQKGGTGKTTTVRNLADVLSRVGVETLTVDADPQGNLSAYFGVSEDAFPTLGEVLAGQAKAVDAIHDGVIPANLGLAEAELLLAGKIGREMTLRNALREAKRRYRFILIDCPPTLGLLTVNALVASDLALISTEAEHFSREGVEQALEVVNIARDTLNPALRPLGVILNIADLRTRHARSTAERLREAFPGLPFETTIRRSISYAESAEAARPILDFRPAFGRDYLNLAAEIMDRLEEDDLAVAIRGIA
jgi:chromosome partitioning protein